MLVEFYRLINLPMLMNGVNEDASVFTFYICFTFSLKHNKKLSKEFISCMAIWGLQINCPLFVV